MFDDLKRIIEPFREISSLQRDIAYVLSLENNTNEGYYHQRMMLKSIVESLNQYGLPEIQRCLEIRNDSFLTEDDQNIIKENVEYYKERQNYNPEDYANLDIDFYKNLFEIKKLLIDFIVYIKNVRQKLEEQIRYSVFGDTKRPQSENIEVLYHTTISSKDVELNGFRKKWNDNEGLGGSNLLSSGKPGISFTSDFYVAKEIARCLKEAILISHGEIKKEHILDWADKDGIGYKVKETYKSVYGRTHFDPNFEWEQKNVFNLYRSYLANSENKSTNFFVKRYDPLFMSGDESFMKLLSTKTPNDVGIIAAECDMTNPDIMYLSSMHEYRVPVEAVLKIVKVIR